jgi:hypothetical protein
VFSGPIWLEDDQACPTANPNVLCAFGLMARQKLDGRTVQQEAILFLPSLHIRGLKTHGLFRLALLLSVGFPVTQLVCLPHLRGFLLIQGLGLVCVSIRLGCGDLAGLVGSLLGLQDIS